MKKYYLFFCVCVVFIFSPSCKMFLVKPPFTFSNAECKLGFIEDIQNYAGVYFSFSNNSEKTITAITVSFLVFSAVSAKNPFFCSNIVIARCVTILDPQKNHNFFVSLDAYIFEIPDSPYIIDYFYVKKIEYEDGSSWSDPYGSFAKGVLL